MVGGAFSAQHPRSGKDHGTSLTLLLHPPQSLFFILPFFWLPRPKPDFLISESHCLFLARIFFMPPPCKKFCFCAFFRCFKIWSLVLSSERTLRPPGDCCGPAGLWGLRPRPPRPRPLRPRPRPPPGVDDDTAWEIIQKYFTVYSQMCTKLERFSFSVN